MGLQSILNKRCISGTALARILHNLDKAIFFSDSQKARKDDWNNVNETNTGQAIVLVFVWLHLALGDKLGLRWRLEEKV